MHSHRPSLENLGEMEGETGLHIAETPSFITYKLCP